MSQLDETEKKLIKFEEKLLRQEEKDVTFVNFPEFEKFNLAFEDSNIQGGRKFKHFECFFQKLKHTFLQIKEFLTRSDTNNIVIFHCKHGKDRTGFYNVAWNLFNIENVENIKETDLIVFG